jgi:AcrR family transcriptional regulator
VHEPPRRADAQRNAARVVRAALSAFEEVGAGVQLEEVAARAGVGIATLYRLFGGRDGLVRAAFTTFFAEEVEPIVLAAREQSDPWTALSTVLSSTVEVLAGHRVLLRAAKETGAISVDIAERFFGPLGEILGDAQRAGQVRDDLVVRDLGAVVVMAVATSELAGLRPSDMALPPPLECSRLTSG